MPTQEECDQLYAEASAAVESLVKTALKVKEERDALLKALIDLADDCMDYDAWKRPCLAMDNARALITKIVRG